MEQARTNFERHPAPSAPFPPWTRTGLRRELPRSHADPRRHDRRRGHVDQLVAAAASVVWLAAFVQSILDEITGQEDSL